MVVIQQVLFFVTLLVAGFFIFKRYRFIARNIGLGKAAKQHGTTSERLGNMLLFAFGQKKMFRKPMVAVFHFFIYAGFIIINIEVLEIILDGLFGSHRLFAAPLGELYPILINAFEVLAVLVIVACIIFLARRNVLRISRFHSREMTTWPKSDANFILIIEIILMCAFLTWNAADYRLQQLGAAHFIQFGKPFLASGYIADLLSGLNETALSVIERTAWWLHIVGILLFAIYISYSKHLHIFLAFPNSYYKTNDSMGIMRNMPEITREVKLMLDPAAAGDPNTAPPEHFGASDVTQLTWKQLMDAYSCTECGRCTAACPANITGKLLSPRKIMMDTRDRLEEVGRNLKDGVPQDDGKKLVHDYITAEELNACTACQACVQECPVNINPLSIIQELRRYMIMEESNSPAEWNLMFSNVETNFAPWKFSPEDRARWAEQV